MSGARRVLQAGPDTCKVSATVTGGQLVEADPTSTNTLVRPASANSQTVLGVALANSGPVAADADPLIVSANQPEVAVGYGPGDVVVSYVGGAAYGALLVAGAAGTVTRLGSVSSAGVSTTTTADAAPNDVAIVTAAAIPVGSFVWIGTGATIEQRTITATAGAAPGPYTLTVAALTSAHASGSTVVTESTTAGADITALRTVVGRCTEPGGVTVPGDPVLGRMRLFG